MVLCGFIKCYMVSFMVYMVVTWFYKVLYGLCGVLYGSICVWLYMVLYCFCLSPDWCLHKGPRSVRVKTDPLIESLSGMHFYDTAAYHMG